MASTLTAETLFFALLGGILPALLWLQFWLRADTLRPEPRGLIMMSFIAGMAGVIVVFPLEKYALRFFEEGTHLLIAWAAIEEIVKFLAIYLIAFKSHYFDEPIDAVVYMVTVALGFAALENTLFLIGPLLNQDFLTVVVTGNLRYLGATLLHVAACSIIGLSIALSFYKHRFVREFFGFVGLILAIALHTFFNFFIMRNNGEDTFTVFLVLWAILVVLIFFFEKAKRVLPEAKNLEPIEEN